MLVAQDEEAPQVLFLLRPAADAEEVDDLHEEPRRAAAALAHDAHELGEAGHEALVADAQERAARHVADAGRLDDQHARPAVGEAPVPVEDVRRDVAVLDRAPGHHRRHPAASARDAGTVADRGEEQAALGLGARRPARWR